MQKKKKKKKKLSESQDFYFTGPFYVLLPEAIGAQLDSES